MKNEIKEITKYKRGHPCRICPRCDGENSIDKASCRFCGHSLDDDCEILDVGVDVRLNRGNVPTEEKTDNSGSVFWVVAIVVVLFLIVAVVVGYNTISSEDAPISENITEIYEVTGNDD